MWQDVLCEHGLHSEFLDYQGPFSCVFRAVWPNLPWSGLLGLLPPSVIMARGSFSLERSCGKPGCSNHASDVSVSLAWLQAGQPLPYKGVDSGDCCRRSDEEPRQTVNLPASSWRGTSEEKGVPFTALSTSDAVVSRESIT